MRVDKEHLVQLYNSGLSSLKVAELVGCCPNTVTNVLRQCGIPIRTLSEAQTVRRFRSIPIREKFREVLDGLLLSDGNLSSPRGFQAVYHQDSSQSEFIDYVADALDRNNYLAVKYDYARFDKRTGKTYHSYSVNSVFSVELQEQYDRWYKEGIKTLPLDFTITPVILMMLYLGDGHKDKRCRNIVISTESFKEEEVESIVDRFLSIGIPSYRQLNNRIRVKADGYDAFMSYIGRCPIGCYEYKFS